MVSFLLLTLRFFISLFLVDIDVKAFFFALASWDMLIFLWTILLALLLLNPIHLSCPVYIFIWFYAYFDFFFLILLWSVGHSVACCVGFFSSVQSFSCVRFFMTPCTAARQASLSSTNPHSLLKLMSIDSVMPNNHLILCHPLLILPSIFLSIRVFSMGQLFSSGGKSIGVSDSPSVLPINIQDWYPLGLTGWISLQSKGLSRVFSNTTV